MSTDYFLYLNTLYVFWSLRGGERRETPGVYSEGMEIDRKHVPKVGRVIPTCTVRPEAWSRWHAKDCRAVGHIGIEKPIQ